MVIFHSYVKLPEGRTRGIPSVSWIFILDPLTARRLQKLHAACFQRLRRQRNATVRDPGARKFIVLLLMNTYTHRIHVWYIC